MAIHGHILLFHAWNRRIDFAAMLFLAVLTLSCRREFSYTVTHSDDLRRCCRCCNFCGGFYMPTAILIEERSL